MRGADENLLSQPPYQTISFLQLCQRNPRTMLPNSALVRPEGNFMKRILRQFNWGRLPAIAVGIFGLWCLVSGGTVVLEEYPKRPAVAPAHWWLDHWWSDLVITCALMFTI